jgi:hypothetical protein
VFSVYLWYQWFAGPRTLAFDEEFNVVFGGQALLHVRVQYGAIDQVFVAILRVDFALDEECTAVSERSAVN